MPPKLDTVNSIKEFIAEFFEDFTCSCACETRSSEDVTFFKTLFDNQSVILSQLQSEMALLRSEVSLLRNQLDSRRNTSPRRLSSYSQKLATDRTCDARPPDKQQQHTDNNIHRRPPVGTTNINYRRGVGSSSSNINRPSSAVAEDGSTSGTSGTSGMVQDAGEREHQETSATNRKPVKLAASNNHGKRKKTTIVGTGSVHSKLSSAPPTLSIHVSRVGLQTSKEDVCDYVRNKLQNNITLACEELVVRSGSYKGYKLTIDSDVAPTILAAEFWPPGIAVKKFFSPNQGRNFRQRTDDITST